MLTFLGALWFWEVLIITVLLFVAIAKDSLGGGLFITLVGLAALQFTSVDVLGWMRANQTAVIIMTAVYFPIGVCWAFLKWYLKLKNAKESLLERKADFFDRNSKSHGLSSATSEADKAKIAALVAKNWSVEVKLVKPIASINKSAIMSWIGYWPISMVWTLLDDFLTAIVKSIYNHISGVFNKMSDKMFQDV